MRKLKVSKISIPAFLLGFVIAACGDSDKNANAANPGDPLTPPTVTFVTAPNSNVGVCPNANPLRITARPFEVSVRFELTPSSHESKT